MAIFGSCCQLHKFLFLPGCDHGQDHERRLVESTAAVLGHLAEGVACQGHAALQERDLSPGQGPDHLCLNHGDLLPGLIPGHLRESPSILDQSLLGDLVRSPALHLRATRGLNLNVLGQSLTLDLQPGEPGQPPRKGRTVLPWEMAMLLVTTCKTIKRKPKTCGSSLRYIMP